MLAHAKTRIAERTSLDLGPHARFTGDCSVISIDHRSAMSAEIDFTLILKFPFVTLVNGIFGTNIGKTTNKIPVFVELLNNDSGYG